MAVGPEEFAQRARLHQLLWQRALEGVEQAVFWRPPAPKANSMAFLMLHLSDLRFFGARQLGLELVAPWAEFMKDAEKAEDIPEEFRPTPAEVLGPLDTMSKYFVESLEELEEEKLSAPAPREFPIKDSSLRGVLIFLLDHEESLLDQLGQMRILFDLPRMDFEP